MTLLILTMAILAQGVEEVECAEPPPAVITEREVPFYHAKLLYLIDSEPEDRGNVRAGSVIRRKLKYENRSGDTLKLRLVSTTCGCTQAEIDPLEVAPGATAQLTLVVNVAPLPGQQGQRVVIEAVRTSDAGLPKSEKHSATIRYQPDTSCESYPSFFSRTVVEGDDVQLRAWFRWFDPQMSETARFLGTDCDIKGSSVLRLMTVENTDGMLVVPIDLHPTKPELLSGKITIKTNQPGRETLEIPAWISVLPRFRSEPGGILIRKPSTDDYIVRLVDRRPDRALPSGPFRIRTLPPDAPISAKMLGAGNSIQVSVLYSGDASEAGAAHVEILDSQENVVVTIPVAWLPPQ